MKNKNIKAKGFTLIELLLVLAAIAALTVIAFLTYPKVQAGRAATAEAQVLAGAQAQIKSLYTSGMYSTLTTAVARNMGAFPDNMNGTASGTLANQWNGAVAVNGATAAGASSTTSTARYFNISYADVPADVCKKLVPAAAGSFGRVAVGGNAAANEVINTYDASTANDTLDEADVASLCGTTTVALNFTAR